MILLLLRTIFFNCGLREKEKQDNTPRCPASKECFLYFRRGMLYWRQLGPTMYDFYFLFGPWGARGKVPPAPAVFPRSAQKRSFVLLQQGVCFVLLPLRLSDGLRPALSASAFPCLPRRALDGPARRGDLVCTRVLSL
jgi:hypothetical protein